MKRVVALLAAVFVLVGLGVAVGVTGAAAAEPPSQLHQGDTLTEGQALFSPLGEGFELILQTDGNLVEYLVSAGRAVWSSRTSGAGETLRFQTDGNIVLYSSTNHALWSTGTFGANPATVFGVNVNGALYAATARTLLWSVPPAVPANDIAISRLQSPNGRYSAVMQPDGNFVVYSSVTGALWSSRTSGHPGSFLVLQQDDSNVVIYGPSGAPLWSTRTSGRVGGDLEMQNDGNLVLYTGPVDHPVAAWSSGTAGRP